MIRDAVSEDAEAISSIRVAAWQAAYGNFMPADFLKSLDPAKNIDQLRTRLSNQSAEFFVKVCQRSNDVVAFSILGSPRYESNSRTVELWALNVLPVAWGNGFGRLLTQNAIECARSADFKIIELWCIKGNTAAEAVYAKAGFKPTALDRVSSELTGQPIHETNYALHL